MLVHELIAKLQQMPQMRTVYIVNGSDGEWFGDPEYVYVDDDGDVIIEEE